MPPHHALDPVYFGKLPTRGDFVRHNASRASVRALDDWLQRGLHAGTRRQPHEFKDDFDTAPAFCFVFSPSDVSGALVGVMQPSRDRSGRRYPFFIALDATGRLLNTRHVAHLPVQLGSFFAQTVKLVPRVVNGSLPTSEIPAQLETAALPTRSDTPALRRYKRYLRQTPLERFCEQLWGHPGRARKRLLLKKLIDVLVPLRDCIPARMSYGLQFPLVSGQELPFYTASFWWETVFRLLRFPDVMPTCFWTTASEAADHPSSLLLFLRPPPARALAPLFSGERESDAVYVLDGPPEPDPASGLPELPVSYENILGDGQLTLWSLLRRL